MARMLGRFRRGGCHPCTEPGPDCSGHERDTRRAKRAEKRLVLVEIVEEGPPAVFFDERDLAIIDSFGDDGECQHGCSGSPPCTGERCTFVCHDGQP